VPADPLPPAPERFFGIQEVCLSTPPFLNRQFNLNRSSSLPSLDHGYGTEETPLVFLMEQDRAALSLLQPHLIQNTIEHAMPFTTNRKIFFSFCSGFGLLTPLFGTDQRWSTRPG
jgi:hypothetical protein